MWLNRKRGILGATSGVLCLLVCLLWASTVPKLSGRINDYAGLIDPATERQLDAALAQLEQTDSTQIVVLTVASLEGSSIEQFAIRVAEQWQPGQKGLDNGVILLVAKKERKIRIEVGYGLEGELTDLVAARIIRNRIVPEFKAGRFDQGIIVGVAAIVGAVRGEFTALDPPQRHGRPNTTPPGVVGLIALIVFTNLIGRVNRMMAALAGGVLAPIAGAIFLKAGILGILALIPIGLMVGYLVGSIGGPLTFGHSARYPSSRRGSWTGGGGFSSGGFGGFSGGGGGFGGGGASGGW